MWMVKGTLLGAVIFLAGGLSYVGILTAITFRRLAQQVRAGTVTHGGGATYDIRIWLHSPILWGALLAALAVGLFIVRARMHPAAP